MSKLLFVLGWTRDFIITPQQFGAKGDGKIDDGAALQKAVDFCILNKIKIQTIWRSFIYI